MSYAVQKITERHPEVTERQIKGVLKKAERYPYWCHFSVVVEGVDQPELTAEHLLAVDTESFISFIAARIDVPICDCDEETMLRFQEGLLNFPEADAIRDFGKTELGLDDEWAQQLLDDCSFFQADALCEGTSWVKEVLKAERVGKIRFRTVEQVKRYRDLGNELYRVLPNPVLRGWKPAETENAPIPCDDIPERDEDIPNAEPEMDRIIAQYGGREKLDELLMGDSPETTPQERKIGRNEPCPCGSGLKYKKCKCAEYHHENQRKEGD